MPTTPWGPGWRSPPVLTTVSIFPAFFCPFNWLETMQLQLNSQSTVSCNWRTKLPSGSDSKDINELWRCRTNHHHDQYDAGVGPMQLRPKLFSNRKASDQNVDLTTEARKPALAISLRAVDQYASSTSETQIPSHSMLQQYGSPAHTNPATH